MNTPITLDEILHPARIDAARKKLIANNGCAGEDALSIRELDAALPHLWPAIEASIRNGTYQPAPLRPVPIPKPTGGIRRLAIPSVLDRLIQHAIAMTLTPPWERRFPPSSFAYRPGTGAQPAISGILENARLFEHPMALRIDIRDYFDRISKASVDAVLRDTPCDSASSTLIHRSLGAPLAGPLGPVIRDRGIPQGSPLSPLISNAILLPFDLSFASAPALLFRYADDMLLLCADESTARSMLARASESLVGLGLELNQAKTRLLPLGETSFLGFAFRQDASGWHRDLSDNTRSSCIHHLRCMEDSGKSPTEMSTFLGQWAAYFLPDPGDRQRHAQFLRETAATFQLPDTHPATRSSSPNGFSYDGHGRDQAYPRIPWAARFFLRRVRFGLHFHRRGFIPIPSGIHINIAGHRIYFRF